MNINININKYFEVLLKESNDKRLTAEEKLFLYEIGFVYAQENPEAFMEKALLNDLNKTVARVVKLNPVIPKENYAIAANTDSSSSINLYNIVKYDIEEEEDTIEIALENKKGKMIYIDLFKVINEQHIQPLHVEGYDFRLLIGKKQISISTIAASNPIIPVQDMRDYEFIHQKGTKLIILKKTI